MAKKDNVHLQLTEELNSIDAELEDAMEALSATNHRIDSFLNDGIEPTEASRSKPAAELPDETDEVDDNDAGSDTTTETVVATEDMTEPGEPT